MCRQHIRGTPKQSGFCLPAGFPFSQRKTGALSLFPRLPKHHRKKTTRWKPGVPLSPSTPGRFPFFLAAPCRKKTAKGLVSIFFAALGRNWRSGVADFAPPASAAGPAALRRAASGSCLRASDGAAWEDLGVGSRPAWTGHEKVTKLFVYH